MTLLSETHLALYVPISNTREGTSVELVKIAASGSDIKCWSAWCICTSEDKNATKTELIVVCRRNWKPLLSTQTALFHHLMRFATSVFCLKIQRRPSTFFTYCTFALETVLTPYGCSPLPQAFPTSKFPGVPHFIFGTTLQPCRIDN